MKLRPKIVGIGSLIDIPKKMKIFFIDPVSMRTSEAGGVGKTNEEQVLSKAKRARNSLQGWS